MNIKLKTISIAVSCACLFVTGSMMGQEQENAFATPNSPQKDLAKEKVAPKEKLVVHTGTMDACLGWMQVNYSIASMQADIGRLKTQIENTERPEAKKAAEKKKQDLENRIAAAKRELERILVDHTIDYVRHEKLQQEFKYLRAMLYERLVEDRLIARSEVRQLQSENERLRKRIAELEASHQR